MTDFTTIAATKTLIDEYMPVSDVAARYEIAMVAPADRVYEILLRHSLLDSPLARFLMALRGLPAVLGALLRGRPRQQFRMQTLGEIGGSAFATLAEKPGQEIVLGLIGQFWKMCGALVRFKNGDEFIAFTQTGYTKAVVNLLVIPMNAAQCLLSTETRVHATDEMSRRKFLRYWKVVGPFSGLLRRDLLRRVKREVENQSSESYEQVAVS